MTRFAVVIPARNAEATLRAALESVVAQTRGDWRAVVVDDDSTDGTRALAEKFGDPRVAVVGGPGRGASAARNLGVAETSSPILAFLDADDIWAPTKLEATARAIRKGADAAFGRVSFFGADPARPTARSAGAAGPVALSRLAGENPTCTMSNVAVTRAAFERTGGFDEALTHAEDLEWLIRLVGGGASLVGIAETLCHYRRSEGGLSSDLGAMRRGHAAALAAAARAGHPAGPEAEAIQLRYLARRALRLGRDPRCARAYALRGLRLAPSAFLRPLHRGLPTLAAALAAPHLPRRP